jgi:nitroimidazol reductase NimA-like FMN-containing flavoprotein (pyridoxamine 5'-phosphate oxidase superfamily)
MITLTDDLRRALTAGRLAHLATINPDGSPQVSVVWIGLDGDDIVVGHLGGGRKVANIAHDPRVGLLHDQVTHSVTRPERPVWS